MSIHRMRRTCGVWSAVSRLSANAYRIGLILSGILCVTLQDIYSILSSQD